MLFPSKKTANMYEITEVNNAVSAQQLWFSFALPETLGMLSQAFWKMFSETAMHAQ